MEVDEEEQSEMQISETNWACEHANEDRKHKHQLTWTREDYGTQILMLPGPNGPQWSSCIRRLTVDIDTGKVIEDRP
eukprot:6447748-Pyramimonas_sp.AAC.1